MDEAAATLPDSPTSTAAERMRLHRKRRRRGLRTIRILLHVSEIEALVRKGYLQADHGGDRNTLASAVCVLMSDALDDSGLPNICLLYTSDAADDLTRVILGSRLITTKK